MKDKKKTKTNNIELEIETSYDTYYLYFLCAIMKHMLWSFLLLQKSLLLQSEHF